MKIFLLFLLASAVLAQDALTYIECPIPGQPAVVSEEECTAYSACSYTSGRCHMNGDAGYIVASEPVDTGRGFTVELTKASENQTLFGADITTLMLEVIYHEDYHVQVKITDPDSVRYEVPYILNVPTEAGSSPLYEVSITSPGEQLGLNITRTDTGTEVFRIRGPLSYENQFLQITNQLPSEYLYGIGEHFHTTLRHPFGLRKTYPIFNRDQIITENEINEYGSHPYYVNVEDDDGNTHSVFLYSSNALEFSTFSILSEPSPAITMRSIGGIFDFHILMGPTPEDVNVQYAHLVGHPVFPQYWNFGFQLSRYGYNSSANYRLVRERTRAAEIPQDVQTFDIDYMYRWRDFTYDTDNWSDLPELIQELHDQGLKVIFMFDPALVIDTDTYEPTQRGMDADVFIKWSDSSLVPTDQPEGLGEYLVGYVWPDNKTVFPDFLKPETTDWWVGEISLFHEVLDFDGIWIDMNEPANFGTNTDRPENYPEELPDWSLKCPVSALDDPPYPTRAATSPLSVTKRLSDKTICMTAMQTDGINSYYHYDVHSLYGISETYATAAAHEALFPGQRYTILSRSTFPGSGSMTTHWLGDNQSLWEHMRQSVIGMIEFNMFAFPMVGADICGFIGEADEELCIRWMQLGAFYPFSRNHNDVHSQDQDPARPGWDICPIASRIVINLRYKYIPYLYALFHNAHMVGHSVIRPLFNIYPSDLASREVSDQFFWGDGMMIAPVMVEGARSRSVYFPADDWYHLETGVKIDASRSSLELSADLQIILVFIRGGIIVPWQEPAMTTAESRQNPFGLTVAIDQATGTSSGEIFWDDGTNEHVMEEAFMSMLEYSNRTLSAMGMYEPSVADGITLETINFYGVDIMPSTVTVNGVETTDFTADPDTGVVTLNLSVAMNSDFEVVLG